MVDFDQLWDSTWGDMQKYGPVHRHHRRILFELLDILPIKEFGSVVEFGCGEASNLAFLQKRFPAAEFFGYDISTTALEKAHVRFPQAQFKQLDLEKSAPERTFDFSLCSDVIEHLTDDVSAMEHIFKATRKAAVFSTVQGKMRPFEKDIGHQRNYKRGELQEKLQAAGFEIVKTVEWGFPFYSPIYRNLFYTTAVQKASSGKFNGLQKLMCRLLFGLFMLNSSRHGDAIFVLAKPRDGA